MLANFDFQQKSRPTGVSSLKKARGGQSQKEKGDVKATKWTSEHGTVHTLEPVKTCLFDLGHIFESSTAIDSLEIGVGLKMVFCRSAMRRLVSTALVLFRTPKPCL